MPQGNRLRKPTTTKELLRYQTPKLIGILESKRLLWDTSDPNFYNLPERQEHWRDLARQIFSNFDICDENAQKRMVLQVKTRWRHVRTAYVRQKKMPNLKKSYIYDKEMAFYSGQSRGDFGTFHIGKGNNKFSIKSSADDFFDSNDADDVLYSDDDMERNEVKPKRQRLEQQQSKSTTATKEEQLSQDNAIDDIFHEILVQEEATNATESDDDESFSFMYEYDGEEPDDVVDKANVSNETAINSGIVKLETFPPMEENSQPMAGNDDSVGEEEHNKSEAMNTMTQIQNNSHDMTNDNVERLEIKPHNTRRRATLKQKRRRRSKREEEVSDDIDDDQCFFDSIKPALRNLDEDDKMDFRIEVMSILRDLKKKK